MNPTAYDLDTPLMTISGSKATETWTARNAVEGVQIFGGIGSGKSSGSARMLALKYLAAGFGGLVLTVKPGEIKEWEEYCRLAGRKQEDLVIIDPDHKNYFNFLEYECSVGGKANAQNLVQVLKTVIRASEDKSGGKSDDPFWETALDMVLTNLIEMCLLAHGRVSVKTLYNVAQSMPTELPDPDADPEKVKPTAFEKVITDAHATIIDKINSYEGTLSPDELKSHIYSVTYDQNLVRAIPDYRTYKMIDQFFGVTYLNLSEKTRSIIDFSLSGFLFNLMRDPVYSLFCSNTSSVTPEDCLNGKIILINLPVKLHNKVGRDCQIMFKYIWQRAMERRNTKENGRPVFLWADEAQHFIHEYDAEYQATARSSCISTVYITQNLANYYANMGGAKAEYRVKSFLGTLNTKIFHANADIETNKYASELIGDGLFKVPQQTNTLAGNFSFSETDVFKVERVVRPEEFSLLQTPGGKKGPKSGAYIHVQGATFSTGVNYMKTSFHQNFKPQL